MKMRLLFLISLILCVAFVASLPTQADVGLKPSARHDHDQQQMHAKGAETVGHHGRGAYGGSDLLRKPSKNIGALDLPVHTTLGGITFWVSMLLNCFFLLLI